MDLTTILMYAGFAYLGITLITAIILRLLPSKPTDKARWIARGFDHKKYGWVRFVVLILTVLLALGYVGMLFIGSMSVGIFYLAGLIAFMTLSLCCADHYKWESFIPMGTMLVGILLYFFRIRGSSGMGTGLVYVIITVVGFILFLLTRLNTRYCRWFKHHVDPSVYKAIKKYTDLNQRLIVIERALPSAQELTKKEAHMIDKEYEEGVEKTEKIAMKAEEKKYMEEQAAIILKDLPEPVHNKKMRLAVFIAGGLTIVISFTLAFVYFYTVA